MWESLQGMSPSVTLALTPVSGLSSHNEAAAAAAEAQSVAKFSSCRRMRSQCCRRRNAVNVSVDNFRVSRDCDY